MAGASTRIDSAAIDAKLGELLKLAENPRPMLVNIGEALLASTRARFDSTQTAPDGTPWAPLSPAYAREKAKRAPGAPILTLRRHLQNITYQADATSVSIGTNLAYAAIHQFGGTIEKQARQGETFHKLDKDGQPSLRFVKKSKANFARTVSIGAHSVKIPARPFLGVSNDDRERILEIVTDFVTGIAA